MDPFNLSRYANLTVQRVQPPEEKPLPKNIENEEEDCSDEEEDSSGSEDEANKTQEITKTEADSERSDVAELIDENVNVKLELENIENQLGQKSKNNEQSDEEIEANSKRKSGEEEDDQAAKKAKMNEEKTSDEDPDNQNSSEKRPTNLRRNIREVMDETKLDESTLSAQRQEMERLRRVQEQQRIIREVQKQIAINKQNTKAQDRVMSLLQGGTTTLIKKGAGPIEPPTQPKPNTIVISTDSGSPQIFNKKMLEILKNQPETSKESNAINKLSSIASKLGDVNEPHMVTSSVSIAPIKPAKIAEIVTISSGSEEEVDRKPQSSDDDCILISGDEEEEDIPDDDTNNCGMHTNDAYNLPDESGRVLINVGHPDNEPDVFLAPQIARIIKPHQIGGVRFLYDNVVESLERFKSSKGFGCILAHSMGLGKTLQVVSFCDVFLRHTPAKHVLCIMPINTLQNWMAEFNMWLPLPDDTNNSSDDSTKSGDIINRQFPLFVLNDFHKTISARGKVIESWRVEGGVLLMGYELYRQLTSRKPRKKRNKKQIDEDLYDEKNKPLLDEMRVALVKPGPDLVICDEGHRIKNSHASTSQSLKEIESRRRVVLTGYPLQNNLLEYWCMVDFVRPNYLGTKTEFSNMFERPIQNGQCIDSTPQDIRLMRHRAHVLHSLLEGFVQRRSHSVLEKTLPQKEEYVLLVRMTPLQRLLYDRFMNEVVRKKAVPNPLKAFAVCCKIWNHPDILYYFLKKRSLDEAEIDLDLEEAGTPLGPTLATSPSAASKRSRNRWPKGGGINPNSKELKINPIRKNIKKDQMKTPAVATVMPNTSNNQLHTPTTHNHSTTPVIPSMQSNQYDDYSSQSHQYGNQGNFTGQQFNNFNQNNYNSSYWKEGGSFYRGNSEYYQSNQSSETKNQFPYPQDPRLEVGEIRMVKSEPSYQTYEETSFSGSNDQSHYQNRGFSQDATQGPQQSEQPLHSQGFSPDIQKVNQSNFESKGTNQETSPLQTIPNIPGIQADNISDQMPMTKPKPKNVRNRKSTINNKQIQKNQSVTIANSGVNIDNSCNDNNSNLTNQQVLSNTKEISFRQAFNQVNSQEVHSNSNQGLFTNNQDMLTNTNKGIFGNSSRNNEDMQFNNSRTSLSESNKGIYGSNLMKQGNDNSTGGMAVSFEGMFDNNRIMTNHQKPNLSQQRIVQNNSIQTNISPQDINSSLSSNQSTLNNQNIQNQVTNHQMIDSPRIMNNNTVNQSVRSQGINLLCDTNNQGQLTSNQGTVQHNRSRSISHDRSMLTGHQEIEQKFVNQQHQQLQQQHQQQQQQQHQQQQQQQQQQHHQQQHQQQQYQNSENVLSNQGQLPIMNPSNSSNNSYNNYLLESNQQMSNHQNHNNYGTILPDSPFQSQNILNDQMLHDQEMLLANDQAMLSVLNSTTDAHEQALLYNAMVGQPDGHGLLGLLEPPSMLNNQINEYQPTYGPLPPNVKPGLPGGAKTDSESNQYLRAPNNQQMSGRGIPLMPGVHNQNESKMYPDLNNRFNLPNSNESYPRYSNYSPMYQQYNPSTSTPLGSISDILDNIPGPERTYQLSERKNPAPCTMTSQDINPLPPFRSLETKTKYEYGGTSTSTTDIDQSHDEKHNLFSVDKESRSMDDNIDTKMSALEEGEIKNPSLLIKSGREEPGIPYDWAVELFNDYVPGMIEASAKMSLLFAIVEESIRIGDRVLLFSQSLFTLDLIEEFLQRTKIPGKDENWCRNCDYYRLDGSTSASEREKLINDFNICNTVHLFLVSTRAGSLGINLVGANRVIVFDASWNPCHDTQAVCRVYRYGQRKPCFVYRLVTDNCLEKKIYDRQINKQVMADRVVDECNPDAHLSIKEVTNLCWDDGESKPEKDFSSLKDNYDDIVIKHIVDNFSSVLTKEPFQHESLFVDRKEKKLSMAEKRLAKRSYEMEKKANSRPVYSYYGQNPASSLYRNQMGKPMASVRPMQSMSNTAVMASRNALNRRWIPAEVWQKQGMSAQEMTLPLDVVIPTNAGDRGSIVLKAGQKVMVLKSPKGIYMQLESGKIIAIRTSANNKTNNPSVPGQSITPQQQQQPPTTHSSTPYNKPQPQPQETSFNSGSKNNDVSMQQLRNRSNLLRNNPSISITPKHMPPTSRSVQSSSYVPPTMHSSAAGSQSSTNISSTYPPKLPPSITLTKYERSPITHKSSEIGVQADSANSNFAPRYPLEYPRFDRYPVRPDYPPRMPQPYNNNYPPNYHRPSSSQ